MLPPVSAVVCSSWVLAKASATVQSSQARYRLPGSPVINCSGMEVLLLSVDSKPKSLTMTIHHIFLRLFDMVFGLKRGT